MSFAAPSPTTSLAAALPLGGAVSGGVFAASRGKGAAAAFEALLAGPTVDPGASKPATPGAATAPTTASTPAASATLASAPGALSVQTIPDAQTLPAGQAGANPALLAEPPASGTDQPPAPDAVAPLGLPDPTASLLTPASLKAPRAASGAPSPALTSDLPAAPAKAAPAKASAISLTATAAPAPATSASGQTAPSSLQTTTRDAKEDQKTQTADAAPTATPTDLGASALTPTPTIPLPLAQTSQSSPEVATNDAGADGRPTPVGDSRPQTSRADLSSPPTTFQTAAGATTTGADAAGTDTDADAAPSTATAVAFAPPTTPTPQPIANTAIVSTAPQARASNAAPSARGTVAERVATGEPIPAAQVSIGSAQIGSPDAPQVAQAPTQAAAQAASRPGLTPLASDAASSAVVAALSPPSPSAATVTTRAAADTPARSVRSAVAAGTIPRSAATASPSGVATTPLSASPSTLETDKDARVADSRSGTIGSAAPASRAALGAPVVSQTAASPQPSLAAETAGIAAPQITAPTSADATVPAQSTVTNLSAQIVSQSGGKTSRFDLQLDPMGLGRVDVAVQIDAKGRASASLSFEKSDSASLLQSHADALSDALTQAGLTLAPGSISFNHARVEDASQTSASAQTFAHQSTGTSFSGGSSQGGGQGSGQSLAQSFSQTGGQSSGGQDRSTSAGGFAGSRAFDAASDAANTTDQQIAAYRTLAPRGVDIRI